MRAVLAHVARHQPAKPAVRDAVTGQPGRLFVDRLGLFDEGNVSPCRRTQALRVVERHAGEQQAVFGDVVPLLARHLAGFAADAHRCIREETYAFARVGGGLLLRCQRHSDLHACLRSDTGAATMLLYHGLQLATAWTPTSTHGACERLDLLDVDVWIERQVSQFVGRITSAVAGTAPVI